MSSNDSNSNNTSKPKTKKPSSRLLTESIAPWRSLRLFVYGALGSGAALGGFLTLAGTIAVLSGARSDLDLPEQYKNLAIDFGALVAFVVLAKLDFDKGQELNEKVEAKMSRTKVSRGLSTGMKEREKALGALEIDLRVDVSSDTAPMQRALVSAVQTGAKQHMVVVIGTRKVIRDALVGANLLKMEFALRDVLILPYVLESKSKVEVGTSRPDGGGFGGDTTAAQKPTWETQPYVAVPVGSDWETYVEAEMNDAVTQNGEEVREKGIAIVVANTGKIVRRGVGTVPWRDIVEELEKKEKEDAPLNLGFLSSD